MIQQQGTGCKPVFLLNNHWEINCCVPSIKGKMISEEKKSLHIKGLLRTLQNIYDGVLLQ